MVRDTAGSVAGSTRASRVEALLFALTVASLLIPIWSSEFFVNQDIPEFLLMSQVWAQLGDSPQHPLLGRLFVSSEILVPGWGLFAVYRFLIQTFDPMFATKLVVTGFAIGLPCTVRFLLHRLNGAPAFAYLSCVFVYTVVLAIGLMHFLFGLIGMLFTFGWVLRGPRNRGLYFSGLCLLGLVLYSLHLFVLLLTGLGVGVFLLWRLAFESRAGSRREDFTGWLKRTTGTLVAFAPSLGLVGLFMSRDRLYPDAVSLVYTNGFLERIAWWLEANVLLNLGPTELLVSYPVSLLFCVLLAFGLFAAPRRARQPEDALLVLGVVYLGFFFVSPNSMADGSLIVLRMQLLPYLLFVLWFGCQVWSPAVLRSVQVLSMLAVACQVTLNTQAQRAYSLDMQELAQLTEYVKPGRTQLFLPYASSGVADTGQARRSRSRSFKHIGSWFATETEGFDLTMTEAKWDVFVIRYRTATAPGEHLVRDEDHVSAVDLAHYDRKTGVSIDYVIVFGRTSRDDEDPLTGVLDAAIADRYSLVYTSAPMGRAKLFVRRGEPLLHVR